MKRIGMCLAVCLMVLTGCAGPMETAGGAGGPEPVLSIGVSILPQRYLAERIGGDRARVLEAVPPGASPANHQPSPADMAVLEKADLFFGLGVPAEEGYRELLDRKGQGPRWVDQQKAVEEAAGLLHPEGPDHGHGHESGAADPHIWLDPGNASIMAEQMLAVMIESAPGEKTFFEANAAGLQKDLEAVDAYVSKKLAPYEGRLFMIFHPAYGYFAEAYGLDMEALEAGGKSATARRFREVVDKAENAGIRNVFYQAESDGAQARALAEELGGEVLRLEPLAYEYIESLERTAELLAETFEDER